MVNGGVEQRLGLFPAVNCALAPTAGAVPLSVTDVMVDVGVMGVEDVEDDRSPQATNAAAQQAKTAPMPVNRRMTGSTMRRSRHSAT